MTSSHLLASLRASTWSGDLLSSRSGSSGSDEELLRSRLAQDPRAVRVSLHDDEDDMDATD